MLAAQPKAALRKRNDHLVVFAFSPVILGQLLPQAAYLDTHGGVVLGIVGRGLSQTFNGNRVLLQLIRCTRSRFLREIDQQPANDLGVAELFALEDAST